MQIVLVTARTGRGKSVLAIGRSHVMRLSAETEQYLRADGVQVVTDFGTANRETFAKGRDGTENMFIG